MIQDELEMFKTTGFFDEKAIAIQHIKDFADNESLFIDVALMSVNRMLEVYRDQDRNNLNEKSFHIIPLVKSDLYGFRMVAVDERFNKIEGFVIRKPFYHSVGFSSAVDRKPDIISAISKLLKDGTVLPIYRDLLNSAINHIWRGQYRLVPVEANTALESFTTHGLYRLYGTLCFYN